MRNQIVKRAGAGLAGALLGALAFVSPLAPAWASSLQVDPVRVEISAQRRIASVRVRNEAATPVTVRIYALTWTQQEGADVYDAVSTVIVSPPIVTIGGRSTQLVRIGMRTPALVPGFYRIIIEEVPQAHPEAGIQVALRMNLPLFVLQRPGAITNLSWSAWQQADQSWILKTTNPGTSYVRIEPGDAARLTGLQLEHNPPMGVVLPRSSRRWAIGQAPQVTDRTLFQHLIAAAAEDQMYVASQ